MLLIKNAHLYSPEDLGRNDILVGGGKILSIEKRIEYIYDIDKSINLNDVRILKCNEEAILVISNDLIKNVLEDYDEKTNKKRIYFYLNPKAQFKHIGNLFLNEKEFEKIQDVM